MQINLNQLFSNKQKKKPQCCNVIQLGKNKFSYNCRRLYCVIIHLNSIIPCSHSKALKPEILAIPSLHIVQCMTTSMFLAHY